MDISLPSRDALKAQAKRLRQRFADTGHPITHSAALEAVAHQWGMRDWNTLSAQAHDTPHHHWQVGQEVAGTYLGHPFTARIKAAHRASSGFWRLTLRMDRPIDVVRSAQMSNLRRQITCVVNARGQSPEKTSDGKPHVVLQDHWSRPTA